MDLAETNNNDTYKEVLESRLASLQCLGCDVYGRWGQQCIALVPKLSRERVRGLTPRVRRGCALKYHRSWRALLGVALQKAVMRMATNDPNEGADLYEAALEPVPFLADL